MDRYTEAATVPFRSLHMGRLDTVAEMNAVNELQRRLNIVQPFWILLPTRLMARPSPFSPPSGYGPFAFGKESGAFATFGRLTEIAVRKFQSQAPKSLEIDGKAGIDTLGFLDELIEAIGKAQRQQTSSST